MGSMPHTFYLWQGKGIKPWTPKYRPLPKNHILLDGSESQIPLDVKFDFVLSQNKYGQYQVASQVARHINIPLISIEHTLPFVDWTDQHISDMSKMRGDLDLFISKYSIKQWKFDENDPNIRIIEHGIDVDLFTDAGSTHNDARIMTCVNDWKNRDWCCGWEIFQRVAVGLPISPVGDTPGFSKPASSTQDLVSRYQRASIFLNTSIISPIPTSVLEAMSCGCVVVSTSTCMIPEIIENGVNGFCSNDEKYLRDRLKWCLNNPDQAKEMGQKARQTILDRFSLKKHVNAWENIFTELYGRGHNQ